MQRGGSVVELAGEAQAVIEGTGWLAIAEGVVVPLPHELAGRVRDLMWRAQMIRRDIALVPAADSTATGRSPSHTVSSYVPFVWL